ncbi:MAG TPA: hypothetical protein VKR06_43240 [Ktedonosporobacter sp.]|nr:hypothetical protein [Ktedonosporobacter sp.]
MVLFRKINRNKLNLLFDIVISLAFVVEMEAHFTGLHYHEVLGVAIAVAFLVHLLLHWRWVVGITKQFIHAPFRLQEARFKYLLNVAVLIVVAVAIVTGILISSTLGFTLPLDPQVYNDALYLHLGSSGLSLLLVGLHIAVDWKWVVASTKKYLFSFGPLQARPSAADNEQSN